MIPKTFALPTDVLNSLTDMAGQPAHFQTEKNTELVVFWASWCPDCKEKISDVLPQIDKSKDIKVVLVNTEKDVERVQKYLDKQQVKMTVVMDLNKKLRKELKINGVPGWAVYKREAKGKPWKLIDKDSSFDNEKVNKALGSKVL